MKVSGRLLTDKEKEQINAPLFKNAGEEWNLHKMAEYVNNGYDKVAQDGDASKMLNDCMSDFKERVVCS